MKYIIDRFEGDIAILENQDSGELEARNRSLLPAGAKEGDMLEHEGNSFSIITNDRAEQIAQKIDDLFD